MLAAMTTYQAREIYTVKDVCMYGQVHACIHVCMDACSDHGIGTRDLCCKSCMYIFYLLMFSSTYTFICIFTHKWHGQRHAYTLSAPPPPSPTLLGLSHMHKWTHICRYTTCCTVDPTHARRIHTCTQTCIYTTCPQTCIYTTCPQTCIYTTCPPDSSWILNVCA